ncbi:MAG: MFS transporter [Bryobacteraceae bacterium]
MSLTGAGFSGTFMLQGAATLGIVVGGYTSDRIAGTQRQRRMLFQAICYLFAAPFLLAFLGKPSYALISVCIFAFSFLRAVGASNEHAILCDLLPAQLRSTAVGVMNTTNCMAGGAGIFLAGSLKQSLGLGSIFAGITGIIIFAALLVLLGYRYLIRKDLDRRYKIDEEQEIAWSLQKLQVAPPSNTSTTTAT